MILFGRQLLDLIRQGDDADKLGEMLTRDAHLADDETTWLIRPGYTLSEWHIDSILPRDQSLTFLMWAAMMGCPNMVETLVNKYNCSVAVTQKVKNKDTGVMEDKGVTALHLAAYTGHATVVRFLLHAGADKNQGSNLYVDSTPLESAQEGKKKYQKTPKKAATFSGYVESGKKGDVIDFRKRDADWPQFDVIIDLLSSSVESQKATLKSDDAVVNVGFAAVEKGKDDQTSTVNIYLYVYIYHIVFSLLHIHIYLHAWHCKKSVCLSVSVHVYVCVCVCMYMRMCVFFTYINMYIHISSPSSTTHVHKICMYM